MGVVAGVGEGQVRDVGERTDGRARSRKMISVFRQSRIA
ncbi:hypothetical protein SNL152K_3506 [Streptomyces sp. NL15-2K]|nr:hypothetical protein SNL152K_3506 [Streptomyces sp. NL15-2K]